MTKDLYDLPDFDDPITEDGGAFATYFKGDTDRARSIMIHEDGMMIFTGGMSFEEASDMLHSALAQIRRWAVMQTLPPVLLKQCSPGEDQGPF